MTLTEKELKLCGRVQALCMAQGINVSLDSLLEFATTFQKDHGILHMKNFLDYADKHNLSLDIVQMTIWHDIAGRNDTLMLPRTSGYKK